MTEQEQTQLTEEEAILKLAAAMKDNAPSPDDKNNVHTFLNSVATSKDTTKTGNLSVEEGFNELGNPSYVVRGAKEIALIAEKIMDNEFFKEYFIAEAENTLATSLSKGGFLVRQATTQTKQVADATKRRKVNKGWFGSQKIEEQGGIVQ